MSLRLILMRHAKSDWSQPGMNDHARPLNPRGQKAADVLGQWLRDRGYLPDLLLSSDATRTRDTFARLHLSCETKFHRGLYLAPAVMMLQGLHRAGGARCVLMLGHNPGIADFAKALAMDPPQDPDFQRYPTCATTVFDFSGESWQEVASGSGIIREFTVPRRLV